MSTALTLIDVHQFAELLRHFVARRQITSIHLHHTWRPNHAQWRGLATLEAIRRYHIEQRGFSDIAQHLTIDPSGGIWTGRDWSRSPASSTGIDPLTKKRANGDSKSGPFMIEMVGDFDDGQDILSGAQKDTVLQVLALLMRRFKLAPAAQAVITHHEMNAKSCAGSSLWAESKAIANARTGANWQNILNDLLLKEIDARYAEIGDAFQAEIPVEVPPTIRSLLAEPRDAQPSDFDEGAVPETEVMASAIAAETARRLLPVGARGAVDPRYRPLEAHVINTSQGLLYQQDAAWTLKTGGKFTSSVGDIEDQVLRQLAAFVDQESARQGRADGHIPLVKVMIHAHGGLVSEQAALDYALNHRGWWLANQIYPIFMVWETGWMETLLKNKRQLEAGSRGPLDWLLEKSLGPAGELLWTRMKHNASLCSSANWQRDAEAHKLTKPGSALSGVAGGARAFVRLLLDFMRGYQDEVRFEFHAVGHSAGSIFHAHFLPMLLEEAKGKKITNVSVATLQFLAPAVRCDLFKEQLVPLIGTQIGRFTQYTMDRKRERDDDVAWVYRKSLLYFVRNACEDDEGGILGLQESIDGDNMLSPRSAQGLFNPANQHPVELHYSLGAKSAPGAPTAASAHGDFDNDPATMTSVLARVLAGPSHQGIPAAPYTVWVSKRADADARGNLADYTKTDGIVESQGPTPAQGRGSDQWSTATGAQRALCIGIDEYPGAPLKGCVNDSRNWSAEFQRLGFTVTALENEQATLAGVRAAITRILETTPDAGQAVIQFAGHGTQFEDQDGDEEDGFDEAYVPFDYLESGCLLDDELNALLRAHCDRVRITLFFDTCHSGSASRFAPLSRPLRGGDERVRYLPATAEMRKAQLAQKSVASRSMDKSPAEQRGWVHIAACTDREYAYETNGAGDFTRAAATLLARAVSESWLPERFLAEARKRLPQPPRQSPQIDRVGHELLSIPLLSTVEIPKSEAQTPDIAPAPKAEPVDQRQQLAAKLLELAGELLKN